MYKRQGYGSYLLKEALRAYAGYDREKATVFTAPLPADAAAVSYTHLDVYKRQMAGRETSSVEHAAEVNFAPANFIITPTEKNTPEAIPVSYTHLKE